MTDELDLMRPRAAACPNCGRLTELPRISPEMLFFRAQTEGAALPTVAAFMPPDERAVAFAGVIYVMPADHWDHYGQMRQNWRSLPLDVPA